MTRGGLAGRLNDPGLAALFDADPSAVCMVGKTWNYHVDVALEIPREENVEMISDPIAYGKRQVRGPSMPSTSSTAKASRDIPVLRESGL